MLYNPYNGDEVMGAFLKTFHEVYLMPRLRLSVQLEVLTN